MLRLVTVLTIAAPMALAAPIVPEFDALLFDDPTTITNTYFPLFPGYSATLEASGIDEDGEDYSERTELSFAGAGREILGIQTVSQLDRAYEDGLLVEETYDYYAQDNLGNVWYFGEDVVNYHYDDDGTLIGTDNESAWLAGIDDALPGYIMPASPAEGFEYYQEVAPGNDALDAALIFDTGASLTIGGILYPNVLVTLETTELDPDAREFKYYAPDVGLIRIEEGLSPALSDPELVFELTSAPVPVPPALPLLLGGLALLGGMSRVRRRDFRVG